MNIHLTRGVLLESLIEFAGFKTGILLTDAELRRHLPEFAQLLDGDPGQHLRMRPETYDEVSYALLTALGAASSAHPASAIDLYAKYQGDPERLDVQFGVGDIAFELTKQHVLSNGLGPIDLSRLLPLSFERFGAVGAEIAQEYLDLAQRAVDESPWNRFRPVDWKDEVELRSLFEHAELKTAYGSFFDQRFIDYLHKNFNSIDDIHWRKFEGLTAEYFTREGAHVELGPGGNDDGVDARIWWPGDDPTRPAAILIQCKREKTKVGKVVLKSLYADVLHEKAKSGLIVTTQALSPGAERVRKAREYPISAADRATLRTWIGAMRSKRLSESSPR